MMALRGLRRDAGASFCSRKRHQLRQVLQRVLIRHLIPATLCVSSRGKNGHARAAVILAGSQRDHAPLGDAGIGRPLTSDPWCQLSAARKLTAAQLGILHAVTDDPGVVCAWMATSHNASRARDYLREYGDPTIRKCGYDQRAGILNWQMRSSCTQIGRDSMHSMSQSWANLSKGSWLALLSAGQKRWTSADEILERGRKALSIATS